MNRPYWTDLIAELEETAICARLVACGEKMFNEPASDEPVKILKPEDLSEVQFQEARALPSDLEHHPHAFVIACIMDQQINAEKAWLIPYRLFQRIGSFDFRVLHRLSRNEVRSLMRGPPALHRFPEEMSKNLHAAIHLIANEYGGDAGAIWAGRPSSAGLVYRFLQFRGVGPKIATMAANILVRKFKVPVSDYISIDISPDVHVRRVFQRLGLIPEGASPEQVIYRARDLNPQFPGLLDLPAFQIGRTYCKPKKPLCSECLMGEICPSSGNQRQGFVA